MAFEATHILFAQELSQKLGVQDRLAYFAGAIYPDTRYVTGLAREVTHAGDGTPRDMLAPGLTDFEKGWATHLYYDQVAGPQLADLVAPEDRPDLWYAMTSLKYLEDLNAYDQIDRLQDIFKQLSYTQAPHGESLLKLEEFLKIQRQYYKQRPSIQDCLDLAQHFKVPENQREIIRKYLLHYASDHEKLAAVSAIYPRVRDQAI
jgi:hypothetical protein